MPLFSLSVGKQQQAAASGVALYPQTLVPSKGIIIGDNFDRATLHPTGAVQIYKEEESGSGSKGNTSRRGYTMTTGAVDGNYESIRTKDLKFSNNNNIPFTDKSTEAITRIRIYPSNGTSSVRIFAGLLFNNEADLTALPTTQQHFGMISDFDADNTNPVYVSYSDGATQTTITDTGVDWGAGGDNFDEIQIEWTGWNDFVFRYYQAGSSVYSTTVNNAFGSDSADRPWDNKAEVAVYIETTTGAKTIKLMDWQVEFK